MVCVYDIYNWTCHQAAPYFSIRNPEWDYVLGFAQEKMPSGKVHTFLHSFNAKEGKYVDPTIQSRYEQQQSWVDKNIWKHTTINPDNYHNYMGIVFPTYLAEKIVFDKEGIVGNVWGYLLQNVLLSKSKTEDFLQTLLYQKPWVIE